MLYFKHSDLAEKYHVSLKTVHNWIDASKQGKAGLKLHQANNRTYIANTPENVLILAQLANKGKKYRNTLHHKVIHPNPEFYKTLSRRQILDIITNLDVHKEIPSQYNYLKDGAANWDNWVQRIAQEKATTNILNGTLELTHNNMDAIERLLAEHKRINVVDLGVGNAYPIRELLSHLQQWGVLHRYIGVDISPSMLDIAERNLKEWYGDDFPFEGHLRDFSYERFDDLLVDDMLDDGAGETINLVLLFGGTLNNFRSPSDVLTSVYGSMTENDLIMYVTKPDTETSRQYFDFNSTAERTRQAPNDQDIYILNMLNVDESLYDVEMGFDKERMMRYVRVRLNSSITIKFDFEGIRREVILEKGETILLFRIRHMSTFRIVSEFGKHGFMLLHSSLTEDRNYFLSISGVQVQKNAELYP